MSNPREVSRSNARYRTYPDGQTSHDENGYMRVVAGHAKLGATSDRALALGKWIPIEMVKPDMSFNNAEYEFPPELP